MSKDIEEAVRIQYVKGYPSLAAFIASDKDKSTAIYRRFDRLSARNLLYLESELVELEARQDAFDALDLAGSMDDKQCARNWEFFKKRAGEDEGQKERMNLVQEIRAKIKEYREALLLESALLTIRLPSSRTFDAFKNVFHNVDSRAGSFPTLGGLSAKILDDRGDLMVLSKEIEEDRLTSFLRHYLPFLFTKRRTDSPLTYISERRLRIVAAILNVVLAAVLLFGAIFNLFYVKDQHQRLGIVAGYTIAFAICIGLISNASRSEVFAACAAYAAVLVVFVSGNL